MDNIKVMIIKVIERRKDNICNLCLLEDKKNRNPYTNICKKVITITELDTSKKA